MKNSAFTFIPDNFHINYSNEKRLKLKNRQMQQKYIIDTSQHTLPKKKRSQCFFQKSLCWLLRKPLLIAAVFLRGL